MFLIFLIFPIVEIYLLFLISKSYGFFNVLALIVFTIWLGLRIIRYKGLSGVTQFQFGMSQGQAPQQKALDGLLVFLAGVLFIIPGLITDVMGVLFLIPWTRRFVVLLLSGWLERKIKEGSFKVYTSGSGFGSVKGGAPFMKQNSQMRDVTPSSNVNKSDIFELPKSQD